MNKELFVQKVEEFRKSGNYAFVVLFEGGTMIATDYSQLDDEGVAFWNNKTKECYSYVGRIRLKAIRGMYPLINSEREDPTLPKSGEWVKESE